MKTIGEKITLLREASDLTKDELAQVVGVSAGAVSKWELDISKPKANSSMKLADFFNVALDSLTNPELEIKYKERMVAIPFYSDVEASAGNGIESIEEACEEISIQASFIPNPDCTVALRVSGDSMEPLFSHNAVVFIDISLTRVIDGRVYVFLHEGLLRMKELEISPYGFASYCQMWCMEIMQ